ncbi:hypothetical protein H0H93_004908, partial [Arthromyces matolae]
HSLEMSQQHLTQKTLRSKYLMSSLIVWRLSMRRQTMKSSSLHLLALIVGPISIWKLWDSPLFLMKTSGTFIESFVHDFSMTTTKMIITSKNSSNRTNWRITRLKRRRLPWSYFL